MTSCNISNNVARPPVKSLSSHLQAHTTKLGPQISSHQSRRLALSADCPAAGRCFPSPPPNPSLVFLRRLFGQRDCMRRFSRTGCVLRAQLVSPQSCPTMIPLSRVIQDLIQMTSAGLGNSLSVFYCTLHRKSGSLRVRFPTTLFKLKVVFSVALGRYISFTAVSDLPTDGIGAQHLSKQPWGIHHLVPPFSTLRP